MRFANPSRNSLPAPTGSALVRMGWIAICLLPLGWVQAEEGPAPLKLASVEASRAEYERVVVPFFAQHCQECHGPKKAENELLLAALEFDMKASTSAARWAMVLEKMSSGEMPPEGSPRPSAEKQAAVVAWIHAEMKRAGKHVARRQAYANGNLVPHELLFNPQKVSPLDAPTRVRRLSPELYAAFTGEVAKDVNVGQPFSPEGKTTFKDMGAPRVDEPITSQLLRNALAIVEKQTAHKIENGEVKSVGFTPKEFLRLLDERQPLADADIAAALKIQFDRVLRRPPTPEEVARLTALFHQNAADAGRVAGVKYSLAAVLLLPEAVFRWEMGSGAADEAGRVRLAPREIAHALAYALTDKRPDASLLAAADKGELDTAEGVASAARKMLDDPKLDKPRILRFFREYFGYDRATEVFKDDKANPDHDPRALVEDTDQLIRSILESDRQVLRELLTTNKSFVAYKTAADTKKKRVEALAKFEAEKAKDPKKFATKQPPKVGRSVYAAYNLTDFPDQQPVELPAAERAGILTQPAWLVAWSQSEDNHAILRGKWVRERLLGGVVPDIPITVDAQLPIAPEKTLRERMAVTQQEYCWKCHQLMNPVGLPFELFDHVGRHRTLELEKPVDASGKIDLGVPAEVQTDVTDAVAMLRKLGESEHVEQVFVRHAFRYWLGRNESPGDARSLQAAHAAYRESEGSMKALIVSLLCSESFLFRIPTASEG